MQQDCIAYVGNTLLTPYGLRTLSPADPQYKKSYEGNQENRDKAYHQGTVWPWLIGPFCEGWLRLHGKRGLRKVNDIIKQFEDVMTDYGVSSVSEVYDGDPPHLPGGTISQAWSVSELLRIMDIADQLSTGKEEIL